MLNPYTSIIAQAALAASHAPHLHQRDAAPVDPVAAPSPEAEHARNVRLAQAATERAIRDGKRAFRGDYSPIIGAPLSGTFRTAR